MFPTDPRQMQKMMKQLGIKSDEIEASEVIIKKKDGSEMVIKNPQVVALEMQGQKSFQITGNVSEASFSDEDVKMVATQSGKTEEEAKRSLEKNKGDIAKAILELQA